MPLANYAVRAQSTGATHTNKDTGGPILLGEAVTITVSPASGCPCTGLVADFRSGAMHPASVLGTGDNPDRLVNGPEAI